MKLKPRYLHRYIHTLNLLKSSTNFLRSHVFLIFLLDTHLPAGSKPKSDQPCPPTDFHHKLCYTLAINIVSF